MDVDSFDFVVMEVNYFQVWEAVEILDFFDLILGQDKDF